MSYSYYEVYTNAQRAFSGLGFPYGADEDAAYIVAWLEAFDLNGVNLFSSLYSKLDSSFNGSFKNTIGNKLDLQKRSCLMVGPGLIDYLTFQANKNNEIKIELINCADPLFLIPLLYRSIKKNIFSNIADERNTLAVINKENIFIHPEFKKNKISNLNIILSKKIFKTLDADNNFTNYSTLRKNLSNGLNPNSTDWNTISKLAFRTYVPESEESREKGAGGGDAND